MSVFSTTLESLSIITYKAYNPVEEKEHYSGELRVAAVIRYQAAVKKIAVVIKAEGYIRTGKGTQMLPVGYIETQTVFLVEAGPGKTKTAEKPAVITPELENYLIGIAYNNTRGLLYERGRNDLMGAIVLPLVAPEKILREVVQDA
ncbi:hypothetical protein SAMN05428949_0443 [Chitinophaga sp. YR627]|uniref:hypothetical protein n=1 Tax=Chitinophaga sp. YR627 TaxID=1881041 RepID=UPI0008EC391A|nr:hypothetical protein [Chitinophaga sp. YR627]SFM68992.1 hypothetical protein SAMN05428949_0443 [Chitinophaga sp. YR627]